MKILLLQDYLRSGGTERQSILLANAFAAARHETTLLTFRPGGALAPAVSSEVRRRSLQPFDLGLDWFAPGLTSVVRALKPDVAVCMGRMANCYGEKLQALCPTIATMRTGKPLPTRFRRSLRAVRHIVANSLEARDNLAQQYGIPPDKISVIYNSLVFPPAAKRPAPESRESIRHQHGATPTTFVLLCVAMFRPEKNQRELIEIAARLPASLEWQLWLAGEGSARAACERLGAEKGLSSRIKFLGFQRDPSALYAAADVAVHASWSESLSNFLIEAQARGLPAVAYEAQGIRECFQPGKTGWAIARDDRDGFRAALTRLAALSVVERATLAETARSNARTRFDPARQVQSYFDLFRRLAP